MNSNKTFDCDFCGKSFKEKYHLTRHRRIHTGEKPYKCDVCEKAFSEIGTLTKHKRIHTGEKPYKCEICEKTFTKSDNLANHKRIHTGLKPYRCDVCNKTFSHSNTLAGHKRIHTGIKPYECDVCKKNFSQRGTLTQHMRIHTGEKPFSCEICQKSYRERSGLSLHRKSTAHMNRIDQMNLNSNILVDCENSIKLEDIKQEIREEENVDNSLSILKKTKTSDVFENIKKEVKEEEESVEVPLFIHQETLHSNVCENIKEEIKEEEDSVEVPLFIHQKTLHSNVCEDIKEEITDEERDEDFLFNQQEIDGIRLYSCDICKEKFTERIVLMMHKDINHSQPIPQSVKDSSLIDNYTVSGVKQEINEKVKESVEGQGVEDSNLDTDHLVDCSQYVQVEMNLKSRNNKVMKTSY